MALRIVARGRLRLHWMIAAALSTSLVLTVTARVYPQDASDQIVSLSDGKQVILHSDFTWEYYTPPPSRTQTATVRDNQIPTFLRGGISADTATISAAIELYDQGWKYIMPRPKSAQAAWGNGDRRTTWWYGYWENTMTGAVSKTDPVKRSNGLYYGDNQDLRNTWRNGGSPPTPTKLEWLLSSSGGIQPR
jgi:hypothetical protein